MLLLCSLTPIGFNAAALVRETAAFSPRGVDTMPTAALLVVTFALTVDPSKGTEGTGAVAPDCSRIA